MEDKNPWKTLKIQEIYDNAWISISHRDVTTPTGSEGIYGVVHFKNLAIGIIPLDDDNNTWLVGQYRYTTDVYSWEIPMGGGPLNTDPLVSAKRELAEETGIEAKRWTKILDTFTSNSVTDEIGLVYIAKELSFGESNPEDTEDLAIKKVPFTEAYKMVLDGRITDALSMLGILKAGILLGY